MGCSSYDFGKKTWKRMWCLCHNCEVTRDRRWIKKIEVMCSCREGTMSRQVGRQVGGYSSTVSDCGRWMKTSDRMNGWKDGGINGRYHSSWTELRLTFPSEEFVSVRSLGQTDSSLTCELELLLIALLHPSGANWKWRRGDRQKGTVNLFKEYL